MLDFRAVSTQIPDASGVEGTGSKGAVEFKAEATFGTRVYNAQVAIQTFKLDQVGNEPKPIDLVQVGAKDVKIKGANKNIVEYVIKTDYRLKPAANYTGEVVVLVIADVARP